MATLQSQFFFFSFLGYSIAAFLYIIYIGFSKKRISQIALIVMVLAFVLQSTAILFRSLYTGHLPFADMYETLMLFSWFLAICYFVFFIKFKQSFLGAFVAPLIFMIFVAASLLPKDPNQQLVPALQSHWLQIHVSLAVLGEAAFATAFALNLMCFAKTIFSKERWTQILPESEKLDELAYKAISLGYPFFTIGALFAGAVWAEQVWGSFWSWDPKEVSSLIVWLIYSMYFHVRFVKGWKGLRAAIISSLGFLAAIFTFAANMILGGLHAYN